jgi:hypothetical protein
MGFSSGSLVEVAATSPIPVRMVYNPGALSMNLLISAHPGLDTAHRTLYVLIGSRSAFRKSCGTMRYICMGEPC